MGTGADRGDCAVSFADQISFADPGAEQALRPMLEQTHRFVTLEPWHHVSVSLTDPQHGLRNEQGQAVGQLSPRGDDMSLLETTGTDPLTVLHEYGHAVDRTHEFGDSYGFFSGTAIGLGFVASAAAAQSHLAARNSLDAARYTYWSSPKEMWARAFAAWASQRLGLVADTHQHRNEFTEDEMGVLGPLVEAILETRCLLRH